MRKLLRSNDDNNNGTSLCRQACWQQIKEKLERPSLIFHESRIDALTTPSIHSLGTVHWQLCGRNVLKATNKSR